MWKEKRQKQHQEALTKENSLCSTLQATYKLLLNRAETRTPGCMPADFRPRITPQISALAMTEQGDTQSRASFTRYCCHPILPAARITTTTLLPLQERYLVSFVPGQNVANRQNARNPCHSPQQQVTKGCPKLLRNQYHSQLFRPCLSFASSSLLLLLPLQFLGLLQSQFPV